MLFDGVPGFAADIRTGDPCCSSYGSVDRVDVLIDAIGAQIRNARRHYFSALLKGDGKSALRQEIKDLEDGLRELESLRRLALSRGSP